MEWHSGLPGQAVSPGSLAHATSCPGAAQRCCLPMGSLCPRCPPAKSRLLLPLRTLLEGERGKKGKIQRKKGGRGGSGGSGWREQSRQGCGFPPLPGSGLLAANGKGAKGGKAERAWRKKDASVLRAWPFRPVQTWRRRRGFACRTPGSAGRPRSGQRLTASDRRGWAPSELARAHTCCAGCVVCGGRAAATGDAEPSLPNPRPAVLGPGGPGCPAPALMQEPCDLGAGWLPAEVVARGDGPRVTLRAGLFRGTRSVDVD